MTLFVLTGFLVGTLIGLTGMGGGLLMTPLLILFFGIHPVVAVGTDLIFAGITKLFGFWQHLRQHTVHFPTVKWLLFTSIPGALSGVLVMNVMLISAPETAERWLGKCLGATFIIVSIVMIRRMWRKCRRDDGKKDFREIKKPPGRLKLLLLGAFGGSLVGLTSVGSGTVFIAFLSALKSFTPAVLVGTDIAHASFLTLAAGGAHMLIGTVDFQIIGYLLTGSIPGILLGSRLTLRIPENWVQSGLILMLFLSGVKLL
ncbi:MAG: sulfite exporter TauE/SafE family protein [Bacillaceae bacterium]|nr:sulfite exporter TauE/SafE family protein [Bacillaceae bacterium]